MESGEVYNFNVSFEVEADNFADAEDIADEVARKLGMEGVPQELYSIARSGRIRVRLGTLATKSLDD